MRRMYYEACVWAVGRWPRLMGWVLDRVLGRATIVWALGHGDQGTEDGWWLWDYWIPDKEPYA